MNIRRFTLGTAVSLVSLSAGAGACTINTTTTGGDDAGPVIIPVSDASSTGDADAAPSAVGLGFTASNLGGALLGMDLSRLTDIDVTGSGEDLDVDCASQATGLCLVVPITEAGGGTITAYVAHSWKIEPTATLNVGDKLPVIMVATSTIEILGHFNAAAAGFVAVAGGNQGMATAVGMGMGGGGVGTDSSSGAAVGGGGGSYCGSGGKGGSATATQGQAGSVYGSPTLVPLLGGSAGGGGAEFGGGGGGAIEMVAGTSIDIGAGGVVFAGGGGGYYGGAFSAGQAASGGGSGGAVLVEAPQVTVEGTIAVNGGGGGGGTAPAAAGADSTANAVAANGGNLGTTGAGGNGAAGATIAGTAGSPGDAVNNLPGGGGGGVGYIRVNTRSGVASLVGTLSPSASTTCVSQGTLAP
jgi:hypothetical protein